MLSTVTPKQQSNMEKLKSQFPYSFKYVQGLTLQQPVEHEIQLVKDSLLLNLGMYHHPIEESEEIESMSS